jgi:hypothetical protein
MLEVGVSVGDIWVVVGRCYACMHVCAWGVV